MFERRAIVLRVQEIVKPGSVEDFPERPDYLNRLEPLRAANSRAISAVATSEYEIVVKNYQLELAEYREEIREVKEQETAIRELATLIIDTVSPELQRTNCLASDNIREWYTKLERTCSVTTVQKEEKAIRRYEELVDTRQKIKNPLEWLTKWEITMAESIQKNVP